MDKYKHCIWYDQCGGDECDGCTDFTPVDEDPAALDYVRQIARDELARQLKEQGD